MAVDDELANGLLKFSPMPVQESFLRSDKKIRVLVAGNGYGKTIVGCLAGAWESMSGRRKGQLPVHGWVVRQTFPKNRYTDPIFTRYWYGDERFAPFIPRHFQKSLTGNPKSVMELTNGSTVTMRTWKQGWKSIQGEMPDWVHVDEECDSEFFAELMVRMFRKKHGQIFVTVTDTVAEPWLLELLEQSERGSANVDAFRADTRDNIHIDQEQIAAFSEGMDDVEASVRLGGGLRMAAGRVYKCWTDANWKNPDELPLDGTDYVFIDPGIANPCAALWVRVMKPERREVRPGVFQELSDLWAFAEYYRRGESDIGRHAAEIFAMNRELRCKPAKYYIDPWAGAARISTIGNSTKTVMQVWKDAGIPVVPASSKRDMFKLERFRATEKCVKLDDKEYPNIYAIRGMKHFNRELFKYVVSGLVDPHVSMGKQRREEFRGDNHLLFGLESAVVMRVKYIPQFTALTASMTQGQIIGSKAWNNISAGTQLFSSSDFGVMLEKRDGTAQATANAAST